MPSSKLSAKLRLPVIVAPMFLISGSELVVASCRAGVIGSFPTQNARTAEELDAWMGRINDELATAPEAAPWMVNIIANPNYPRRDADLALILKHRPPVVVTALGNPRDVVEAIHGYGGIVLADVINPRFARKAIEAGVDGLVLVAAGAGGHTGQLSGFVFVQEVREFWDGPLVLGGGIATGRAVKAAQVLGADLAYMGTHFIPTRESMADERYKRMIVDADCEDIVCSDAITGVKANWLRPSLIAAGLDPDHLPPAGTIDFAKADTQYKRWKTIWSAGQGVGSAHAVLSVAEVVDRLVAEYRAA
ncbi:MAG: nitronate monooxygenase [Rhodospirillales bacterium]|nr:nitronate monooxygenase [Rhodospirillales bacterium]